MDFLDNACAQPWKNEHEGYYNMCVITLGFSKLRFRYFLRVLDIDTECLDSVLNQVSPSKFERGEQVPTPYSDVGEPEQSRSRLPPVLRFLPS